MDDTICGIATPAGEGGIGIIRLSGPQSIQVASRVVRLRSGQALAGVPSFHLHVADFMERAALERADPPSSQPTPYDEGLVVVMRAPRSYTREDIVEIHCHGGALILKRLCESLLHHGARLAQPGEFTKRAFLNGRLDLAQAEAVLDTIRAKTDAALRLAQDQLRGTLSTQANVLRERLLALLAHVEAGIDFVEEDVRFIGAEELIISLRDAEARIARWLSSAERGRILRDGLPTVIVGRPNVGKSSLLNALAQRDRAIVTPIPGTTRDVLEEYLNVEGIPLRLLDTAGLRETTDPVEQEGVRRTRQAIDQADLILLVLDASQPLQTEDWAILAHLAGKRRLIVRNKMDLPARWEESALHQRLRDLGGDDVTVINISALTGQGMDALGQAIASIGSSPSLEPAEIPAVTRLRHCEALGRCHAAIQQALQSVSTELPPECVALDLRAASDALGELTGAITTDEILERIFSEFCIGK